jgi:23S rRNA (adenine2503-C2)-methyltransferase
MKIVAKTGREDIAIVYIGEMENGKRIEFVESVQPPVSREKKWVLIISTLYGCPIRCPFCDAGNGFKGRLSKSEIFAQIDYMVLNRFPDRIIPVPKFKIQFARMGEPALNPHVLAVLDEMPGRFQAPGLLPTLSTVAPEGCDSFFQELLEIKNKNYGERFQMQFSIHTTDSELRDKLIPVKKWSFKEIAAFGTLFHRTEERKITLNFALAKGMPVKPDSLLKYFDPNIFIIKITPVNPTYRASRHGIVSLIHPGTDRYEIIEHIREAGYEVLLSIGEWEENQIGSNCGQYITNFLKQDRVVENGYTFPLEKIDVSNHS